MNRPILIHAAMDVELDSFLDKLDSYHKVDDCFYIIYEGLINNYPVVLLVSGVGTILSSSALTYAILKYNPFVVINEGVAGSLSREVHKKDIVIGCECININSYRTLERKIGEGSNLDGWEFITFLSGEEDRFVTYKCDSNLLEIGRKISSNNHYGNIVVGAIGSGDIWNKEIDRLIYLNTKYNILCEDMECISVYTVCDKFNIPTISIKIMSDNVLTGEEYDREVGKYLQDYIYDYVLELLETREKKIINGLA